MNIQPLSNLFPPSNSNNSPPELPDQNSGQSSSVWGKSTIVELSPGPSQNGTGQNKQLSPQWQNLLDRLKADPKAAKTVMDAFAKANQNFAKDMLKTVESSSISKSAAQERQKILKEMDQLRSEIDALKASGSGSKEAIQGLISRLETLGGELKGLQSSETSTASMGTFDGLSVATNALNAAEQNPDSQGSGSNNEQQPPSEIGGPDSVPPDQQAQLDEKLTNDVYRMQNMTEQINTAKTNFDTIIEKTDDFQDTMMEGIDRMKSEAKSMLEKLMGPKS